MRLRKVVFSTLLRSAGRTRSKTQDGKLDIEARMLSVAEEQPLEAHGAPDNNVRIGRI